MTEMLERYITQLDVMLDTYYRWQYQQCAKALLQFQEAMMQENDRETYKLFSRLTPEERKEIGESMRRLIEARNRVAC